ncbi:MAG: hypothetical protein KDK54_05085 [Leptospiraceae bacterium]|nr:hypothetical protein [Leptospiraceae bacterium]
MRSLIYRLILAVLFLSCSSEAEEKKAIQKAKDNLYLAIAVKNSDCNGMPDLPLLITDKKPSQFGLNACTYAIIQSECPFQIYPPICLEIYHYDVKDQGPRL